MEAVLHKMPVGEAAVGQRVCASAEKIKKQMPNCVGNIIKVALC